MRNNKSYSGSLMQKGNPLSADILINLFRTSPKDPLRIINREGSTIEFKESYSHAGMAQRLPIIQVAISFLVLETSHGIYWA